MLKLCGYCCKARPKSEFVCDLGRERSTCSQCRGQTTAYRSKKAAAPRMHPQDVSDRNMRERLEYMWRDSTPKPTAAPPPLRE